MGKATIFISGTVSQMPRYRDVQTKNGPRTVMSFNVPADHGWGEGKVSTFFSYYIALPQMLFPGGQLGVFTCANLLHSLCYRNGILAAIHHTGNPANRIGMPLTDALAPEGIILSLR